MQKVFPLLSGIPLNGRCTGRLIVCLLITQMFLGTNGSGAANWREPVNLDFEGNTVQNGSSTTKGTSPILPEGWHATGSAPNDYHMSVDRQPGQGGKSCGTIKSFMTYSSGFGSLIQTVPPDLYFGRRIRLSGRIKTDRVEKDAGLWLRTDGKTETLLDNMSDRPITGTTDWTTYSCVLDAPKDCTKIAFGVLLDGKGQVWLDDVKLEIVGPEVPTTKFLSLPPH